MDSNLKVLHVPLASIDEDDGDDDEETVTVIIAATSMHNRNKLKLNNGDHESSRLFTSMNSFGQEIRYNQVPATLNFPLLSPVSDDLNTPITSLTHHSVTNINTDTSDEFGNDTGFFSSTSLSSSKRSSIDFDSTNMIMNNHSFQFNSLLSSKLSHSFINDQQINGKDCHDDELLSNLPTTQSIIREEEGDTILNIVEDDFCSTESRQASIPGSLEDLVKCFDEKVKSCLKNFDENVSKLAPVQIRSQEEVIKNRPAWWTLTGNYGSILPIDWGKLSPDDQINDELMNENNNAESVVEMMDDDFKLNKLINSCLDLDFTYALIKTPDEVINEIDDIISGKSLQSNTTNNNGSSNGQDLSSSRCSRSSSISFDYIPLILRSTFYRFSLDKLKTLSLDQLQDLHEDLEGKTQKHSQELINRLSERDELEFEKEVKNTFLSLLVKIHKRRKEYYRKYGNNNLQKRETSSQKHRKRRYLTTVIPYCKNLILNNLETLQTLIKILKAMLEDSPAIPTMLTDYILKFICPSESNDEYTNNLKTKSTSEHQSSETGQNNDLQLSTD